MRYLVIQYWNDDEEFEKMVKQALEAGWRLQGGVSVAVLNDDILFAQAMVKDEEEDDDGN